MTVEFCMREAWRRERERGWEENGQEMEQAKYKHKHKQIESTFK